MATRRLGGLALVVLVAGVWACGDTGPIPIAPDGVPDGALETVQAKVGTPDDPVVVQFGREHVGSPFRPPDPHDASFHAIDAIRPRTVVVEAGSTVRFEIAPAHKPAVYEPGTTAEDIDVSSTEDAGLPFPFPPLINDEDGRLARGDLNVNFATGETMDFEFTFEEPGRYLVICEVVPHFVGAKMYAWVEVK